jgi:hypothetical protein
MSGESLLTPNRLSPYRSWTKNDSVEKLLKALLRSGSRFLSIGAAAAVLHGWAYVTDDLDICYSKGGKSQIIATALAAFNLSLRTFLTSRIIPGLVQSL